MCIRDRIRGCMRNVCTQPTSQTGYNTTGTCVGATMYVPNYACKAQSVNLGTGFGSAADCLSAAGNNSKCGSSIQWSKKYNKNWGCRCCKNGMAIGGRFNKNWALYKLGAATGSIACPVQPTCATEKDFGGTPADRDHQCLKHGLSLIHI